MLALRLATPADRAFVERLGVEAFAAYGPHAARIGEAFDSPAVRTMVCEEDGEPVGFSMARAQVTGAPDPEAVKAPADLPVDVELGAIAVLPPWRRRGAASLLLGELVEVARRCGAERAVLHVAEDNHAARALFERAGFKPEGDDGCYPAGQRALRMACPLQEEARR